MSYQLKLWDSKRERENNLPEHIAGRSQNKGTEQVQRRARRLRTGPAPPETRQRGGERGRLGPKDRSPYRTANRPPVSNQRPPEIPDGRHPPGESLQDTGRRHPTRAGGDWGWGCGGQKARRTRGECARQAPGCLSRSDREGTKSMCSILFRAFVEHSRAGTARSAGHAPYGTAGSLSSLEGKGAQAPPRSATQLAT